MPRGESTLATWDSDKRQRVPIGSTRIRNGIEQIKVESKGWTYWIANTPEALRRHNKQCDKPSEADIKLINECNGNLHKGLTAKQRYRLRQKGVDIPNYYGKHLIGTKKSKEHRQKIGDGHRIYFYDKVASDKKFKKLIRNSAEYKEWRKAVFERDDFTCQKCGSKSNYIEAHHLKSFTHYPEFRFNVSNGETLCRKCHREENRKQMQGNGNGKRTNMA